MITADALHTQRAHAHYPHERGTGFMFTAKQNQPRLYAALDSPLGAEISLAVRDVDTSHGRITTRTIQVLPAPADLPFPHVNQVWLIERYTSDPAGTPLSAVAALGVTTLTIDRATPAELAALVSQPLAHRVAVQAPRHRLLRGQLHHSHQLRTQWPCF